MTLWRGGAEDHWRFNTRTNVGFVQEVNPVKGTMRVQPLGHSVSYESTVPQLGLTFNGANSSWIRYMPDEGAQAQVTQNLQGRWEGLGYTHWSPSAETNFNSTYQEVTRQAESGENGYRQFRTLGKGEFDMRSAGGAYIRGDRLGTLALEGQAASLRLSGGKNEAQLEAELTRIEANGGSYIRLGEVKRTLPPTLYTEQTINVPGGASLTAVPGSNVVREWAVNVGVNTAAASLSLYNRLAGDVRDGLGASVVDARTGGFLRDLEEHYLNDGVQVALTKRVDNYGRVTWNQGTSAALGVPTIPGVSVTLQGLVVSASSGNVAVSLPGASAGTQQLLLGSQTAIEAAVKGTTWGLARATLNSQLITFVSILSAAATAFGTAFSSVVPSQPAAATAAGALSAAALNFSQQVAAFEAGASSYLSLGVFLV